MSTPRRGIRRPQSQRPPATQRPAGQTQPPAPPAPQDGSTVRPPASAAGQPSVRLWLRVLEWVAWILLWVSALGAGYAFGKITVAKVLFMAIMLAITGLPWLRWVRADSVRHLPPDRVAMVQGSLAIFVGLVFVLSGAWRWALAVVVVQLALALVILIKAPRSATS